MPYLGKDRRTTDKELDTTIRILNTVRRQMDSYALSLEKIQILRREISGDAEFGERIRKSPEDMMRTFESRGIPLPLASAMTAEEFKRQDFPGAELGIWTWDCCCSGCCITCITTNGFAPEVIESRPGVATKFAPRQDDAS
jgi:hypothetical protein